MIPQNTASQKKLPPNQLPVDRIRDGIAALLRSKSCRDFVNKLLFQAFAITGNLPVGTPLAVFDWVREQGGFVFGPYRYQNTMVNYGVGFVGEGGSNWAQVQINNEMMIVNEPMYFGSILHELIHVSGSSGNYDDRVLAMAANQAGLIKGDLPDASDVLGNSRYWTGGLHEACVPVIGHKPK